jgi:hypothetical protein
MLGGGGGEWKREAHFIKYMVDQVIIDLREIYEYM